MTRLSASNTAAGDAGGIFAVGELSSARTTITQNRSNGGGGGGISTLGRATIA